MPFTNQIQDCPCKHLLPASQTTKHVTFNLILQCVSRVNTVKCWPHWLGVCKESNHSLQFFSMENVYPGSKWRKSRGLLGSKGERAWDQGSLITQSLPSHVLSMVKLVLYWMHLFLAQNYPQLKEQAMHRCSLIWLLQTEWHAIR